MVSKDSLLKILVNMSKCADRGPLSLVVADKSVWTAKFLV